MQIYHCLRTTCMYRGKMTNLSSVQHTSGKEHSQGKLPDFRGMWGQHGGERRVLHWRWEFKQTSNWVGPSGTERESALRVRVQAVTVRSKLGTKDLTWSFSYHGWPLLSCHRLIFATMSLSMGPLLTPTLKVMELFITLVIALGKNFQLPTIL